MGIPDVVPSMYINFPVMFIKPFNFPCFSFSICKSRHLSQSYSKLTFNYNKSFSGYIFIIYSLYKQIFFLHVVIKFLISKAIFLPFYPLLCGICSGNANNSNVFKANVSNTNHATICLNKL